MNTDEKLEKDKEENIKLSTGIPQKIIGVSKKILEKMQKFLVYLYPEIERIPKGKKVKRVLKKTDIIKIALLVLSPIAITLAYITLPLKFVNISLLATYIVAAAFKTVRSYKKEKTVNKDMMINILLILIMTALLIFTIFKQ